MKLFVQVLEARNLCARDSNGFSDPFVRLSLGSTKSRTSVVHKNLNPSWNEDFFFNVSDMDDELKVTVWDEDRFSHDFLGQTKLTLAQVLNAEKQTISNTWFPLQKRNEKSKLEVSGEILLQASLFGRTFNTDMDNSSSTSQPQAKVTPSLLVTASPRTSVDGLPLSDSGTAELDDFVTEVDSMTPRGLVLESPRGRSLSPELSDLSKRKSNHHNAIADKLSAIFSRRARSNRSKVANCPSPTSSIASDLSSDLQFAADSPGSPMAERSVGGGAESSESCGEDDEELVAISFFQDDEKSVGQSPEDLPAPLPQGILVDQSYSVTMKALNALIFGPNSQFIKELAEVQKTTEYVEEPWKKVGNEPMKRNVVYRKAATKLVKAVLAYEEQTYLRADDKGFAVLCSVHTPDVIYGKTFLCELLYVITPGNPTEAGTKTCNLMVSWRMNYVQNTMMKTMINNGAATGLRDNYTSYREVLSKYAKALDANEGRVVVSEDRGVPKTDWELAREYFGNYTVLWTAAGILVVLIHIVLVKTGRPRGLQFWRFDLPDSFGELFIASFLTRYVETVARMVQKFLLARLKTSHHGVKAQGDGWLLTVALVEAENLYSVDSDGFCDPYVVFTCNGKIRTSSVKLGCLNPGWKEVYEFDATEDPPSTLDLEVFDFDGPFSEAVLLGHASINFLKCSTTDLADMWLPLVGKNAQAHGSKLHVRIILTNTKVGDRRPEYMEKVEKEVGTKLVKRSPQQNTQFQKLFSLPQEEFLINDYACAIKRKIPMQGRLFLSPRMLGFYSNLFGHKTKFSFLWEDIEEIKEVAPSRGVLFNPSIIITIRKGRAHDALHASRGLDPKGRYKFQFLQFVRPGPAFRTIIALWKNRTLTVEQQMDLIASVESGDMKYAVAERQRQADDTQPFLGVEDAHMSELAIIESTFTAKQLHFLLEKGDLDRHVMQLFGVNNYKASHWEMVGDPNVKRRQVSYTLNRQQCRFGSSVTSIQQKTLLPDSRKGVVEELMTLHDVPFGDHFQVQIRREFETTSEEPPLTVCRVFAGVAWHKSAGFQKKITTNILRYMTHFLKDYFELVKKVVAATPES